MTLCVVVSLYLLLGAALFMIDNSELCGLSAAVSLS